MRKIAAFLFATTLGIFSVFIPTAQAENVKIDYVALGDSVASGQTPYGEKVGRGFTDMINEVLVPASFNKEYATSGETSDGLLETLKRPEVQQSINNAELVTIISGANDFIDEMYDPAEGTINVDLGKAITILNEVTANLTTAVKKVKTLNPNADIYLFGYYFPLPHYEDEAVKEQLEMAFRIVNSQLATIAQGQDIYFVEVASAFDKNGTAYIENPKDIHPNEAGYQVIADQFFLNYKIPLNGTFPSPSDEWGNTIDKLEQVSSDKKWTITTNRAINAASVMGSVYMVKDGAQLINVGKELSKDGKHLSITAPKQGYKSGYYQLMITNDLKDTSRKSLKTSVLMNFSVN